MSARLLIEKLKDIDMEWRVLGDFGEFTYGHVAKAQESGNARFVRITDIDNQGQLITTDPKYVDINEDNERFILKKNDLLMARTGATYGKTMIFDEDYPAIYAGFLIKISLDEQLVAPRFYWHFAQSQFFRNQANKLVSGGGQPQFNANVLREVKMPIPCPENPKKSLEIQTEIVRILDAFTAHTAELTAELTARKKQYHYYRDKLLSFEEGEVEWRPLGDVVATIKTGKLNANAMVEDGEYPFFTCDAAPFKIDNYAFDTEAIIVSGNGSQVGHINYYKGKFNAYQRTYILADCADEVSMGFLLTYLKAYLRPYIMQHSKKGSVPYITMPMLQGFKVPVPSAKRQFEITSILDKFDTLTNSITEGLPREIELRQKQYEYYRDLLLSFPRSDAEKTVSHA